MDYSQDKTSQPVAEISTWQNSCALSCASVFLVNAFLAKKLSKKAEDTLVQLFNDYYKTYSVSTEQLRDIFSSVFPLPSERQVVLGPVLRGFLAYEEVVAEKEDKNMLSNEAFNPLAKAFDFNVTFFADVNGEVGPSNTIPPILLDKSFPLTLRPYYHNSHFDLIMDDKQSAQIHNQLSFDESVHKLSIEKGEEDKLKNQIQSIIFKKYNPEQQRDLTQEVGNLFKLAKSFQDNGQDVEAQKVVILADGLQKLGDDFFKKTTSERSNSVDEFHDDAMRLIQNVRKAVWGSGLISWGRSFFNNTEQKHQLDITLNRLNTTIAVVKDQYLLREGQQKNLK